MLIKSTFFKDFQKIFYGCLDLSLIYHHAKNCEFPTKTKLTVALKPYPILASLRKKLVYSCLLRKKPVYSCLLRKKPVYSCLLRKKPVYSCLLRKKLVYSCLLRKKLVYSCLERNPLLWLCLDQLVGETFEEATLFLLGFI